MLFMRTRERNECFSNIKSANNSFIQFVLVLLTDMASLSKNTISRHFHRGEEIVEMHVMKGLQNP